MFFPPIWVNKGNMTREINILTEDRDLNIADILQLLCGTSFAKGVCGVFL